MLPIRVYSHQAADLQPRHSLDDLFNEAASDDQKIKVVPVPVSR